MEAFFDAATRLDGIPVKPELARLFHEHGMELLDPPLLAVAASTAMPYLPASANIYGISRRGW